MNKVMTTAVLAVMVMLAGMLTAQESAAPRIIAAETSFDFGKVVQGTEASHVFEVRNGGNAPLEIERIQSS